MIFRLRNLLRALLFAAGCVSLISVAQAQDVEAVAKDNGDAVVLTDDGQITVVAAADGADVVIEAFADNEIAVVEAGPDPADAAAEVVEDDLLDVEFVAPPPPPPEKAEFQADGENAIGRAIGGFIRAIGQPLKRPAAVSDDVFSKDVDKIKDLQELLKLERALRRDQNVKQIHPRVKQRVDKLRDIELEFLHLTCNLKRSEFTKIQKLAKDASARVIIKQCQAYGRQFGAGRRVIATKSAKVTDDQKEISTTIISSAKILGEERLEDYEAELKKRNDFRKVGVVGTLTSGLDGMLHFNMEQRAKVKEILLGKWDDAWNLQFQYFANIEYVSGIPKAEIQKILTDEQKAVFDSINWQPQNAQQMAWNNQIDIFGFGNRNRGRLETRLKFAPEEVGDEQEKGENK